MASDRSTRESASGIADSWSGLDWPPEAVEVVNRRAVVGVVGTVAFLLAWTAAASFYPPYLLPSPLAVVTALVSLVEGGEVFVKLGQSFRHFVPGLVVGTAVGVGLGIALGWSGLLDDALSPVIRILRPVPPLAWIAVAIVWFGIGHVGAAFIVSIGALWINFYNSYSGVKGVSTDLKEVAASLGVHDGRTMIRRVVLPAATPEIITGIRTGIGRCWMLVVAAELFGAPGIGYEIINASQNLAMDVAMAYMLVISVVYLVMDVGVLGAQRRLLAWRA